MRKVLQEYNLDSETTLLQEVGLGNRMATLVARQLIEYMTGPTKKKNKTRKKNGRDAMPLMIQGTEGMVVNFPKCCLPIPGDRILGFVTAGRGIVVHHQSCPNVAEYRNHPEKWINVEWERKIKGNFPTNIRVDVTNQRGVLAKLASTIADLEANIVHVEMKDRDDRYTTLKFVVEVHDRLHLARIMRHVRKLKHVARISRH
jgi:guanosine-3',5'-bis(diphosphate) 3'-pyrophosphohydrolase